jgi:hypothetical protein
MRSTKLFLMIVFAGFIAFTIGSCKRKCKNDAPEAAFVNNSDSVVGAQIKEGGIIGSKSISALTDPEVPPGATACRATYNVGDLIYSIKVKDTTYTKTISVSSCNIYMVAIDKNNKFTVNITPKEYR